MKHKRTRAAIIAILTCSFCMGSLPASVAAWQVSRAIERAQMGYGNPFVTYENESTGSEGTETAGGLKTAGMTVDDAVGVAEENDSAPSKVKDIVQLQDEEIVQREQGAGGVFQ